jgi:hypothetical protein
MAKAKPIKIAMPDAVEETPEGMVWKYGQELKAGDILRMRVENPGHPKYGQYAYSVCNGGGFGCNPTALGNAIFVHSEGFDLKTVISHAKDVRQVEPPEIDEEGHEVIRLFKDPSEEPARQPGCYRMCDGDRWERFWGIYTLRPAVTE